jgi:hypothetical protein
MSTLSPSRSASRPLSRQTMLITGVVLAIVIAVTVLVLTTSSSSTSTRPASGHAVTASPVPAAAAAQASDAAHFGAPAYVPTYPAIGMGHR